LTIGARPTERRRRNQNAGDKIASGTFRTYPFSSVFIRGQAFDFFGSRGLAIFLPLVCTDLREH
jgi:hypothetical protein